MIKKVFILLIVSFYLLSCIKEISVDIPKKKPKLVAYSTIVPFTTPYPKPLSLKLESTAHIFDTTTYFIKDAQVLYFENDIIKDTLEFVDSLKMYKMRYDTNDNYPVEGNRYAIKVIKEGFETITASTIIPPKVEIEDTNVTSIAYIDDDGMVYSELSLTFTDPSNEINYYELMVSDFTYDYNNLIDFYELSTYDNLITSESYYPSLIRFYLDKPKYLLFNDQSINGETHTLNVYYAPPQTEGKQRRISDHNIRIHLRTVTEDYYKFKTTMIQHLYGNTEDVLYGMGEPLNVYSNIENGYGLFAGFNHHIVTLHIPGQIINE